MELFLNDGNFDVNVIDVRDLQDGGIQYLYKFDNGYGASVVKRIGSYGHEEDLWELAVIKFYGDDGNDWGLVYDTKINPDVIGYLSDNDVQEILSGIKNL